MGLVKEVCSVYAKHYKFRIYYVMVIVGILARRCALLVLGAWAEYAFESGLVSTAGAIVSIKYLARFFSAWKLLTGVVGFCRLAHSTPLRNFTTIRDVFGTWRQAWRLSTIAFIYSSTIHGRCKSKGFHRWKNRLARRIYMFHRFKRLRIIQESRILQRSLSQLRKKSMIAKKR